MVSDSFSQKRVNDATGTIKLLAGTGARKDNAPETTAENGTTAESAAAIYQRSLSEGIALADVPLSGFRQQNLEKIAMLLEETDDLSEPVE